MLTSILLLTLFVPPIHSLFHSPAAILRFVTHGLFHGHFPTLRSILPFTLYKQ